ncbi:MAG: hypothetical protein K2X50_05870 [Gammaproteobacteria bacterium]|nr:hypothetical protein [Gammaproteobacteria bacterium]
MAKSDKDELDNTKSSAAYKKLVEQCKDYQKQNYSKGLFISFLKAQDIKLLDVLSKDLRNIKLCFLAKTAANELRKDNITSITNIEPEEVKRRAKPKVSITESMQFNVNVVLPAIVILKKAGQGDEKALVSFLRKQDPESLQKLRMIEPKTGLISVTMAKELKSCAEEAIILNVKQAAEKFHDVLETPKRPADSVIKEASDTIQKYMQKSPDLVQRAYEKIKEDLEQKLIAYKIERTLGTLGAKVAVKVVEHQLEQINLAIDKIRTTPVLSSQVSAKK